MSVLRDGDEKLHYSDNSHKWIAPPHIKQSAWDTAMKAHVELHRAAMGTPSRRSGPGGPGHLVAAAPVGPGRPVRFDPAELGAFGAAAGTDTMPGRPTPVTVGRSSAVPAAARSRAVTAAGRSPAVTAARPGESTRPPDAAGRRAQPSGPGAAGPSAGRRTGTVPPRADPRARVPVPPVTPASGGSGAPGTPGTGRAAGRGTGVGAPVVRPVPRPGAPGAAVRVPGRPGAPGVVPPPRRHGIVPAAVILARSLADDQPVPPVPDGARPAARANGRVLPAEPRTTGARIGVAAPRQRVPRPAHGTGRPPAVRTARPAADPSGVAGTGRADELRARPAS